MKMIEHIFEDLPERPSTLLTQPIAVGQAVRDSKHSLYRVEGTEIMVVDRAPARVYVRTKPVTTKPSVPSKKGKTA